MNPIIHLAFDLFWLCLIVVLVCGFIPALVVALYLWLDR